VVTVFLAGGDLFGLGLAGLLSEEPLPDGIWTTAAGDGLVFAASLMSILLAHEFGHYLMARRNGVPASLPYFIPLPPPFMLGTMGAVIVMRDRIRSRAALMEVGATGPIAGMAVAIPLFYFGLLLSPVLPLDPGAGGIFLGQSLLGMGLERLAAGPIPEGHDIFLHPMAMAGWVGFLVTMLNLLPIGQLDGGHVFYALFGRAHAAVSRTIHRLLFLLGVGVAAHGAWVARGAGLALEDAIYSALPGAQWIVLGLFLGVLHRRRGFGHPPTDDDTLPARHAAAGVLCLAIFIATFMPVIVRPIVQ